MDKMSMEFAQIKERFRGFLPIVVDVETGGFDAQTDALLEIAMVTLNMDAEGILTPAHSISAKIEPFAGANIEAEALEFTGIDLNDPQRQNESESESHALNRMFKLVRHEIKEQQCNRAILVGHNAHFDHGFLRAAVARNQIKRDPFHPFSSLDTASLSALCLGHTVLAKACKMAGIEFSNKHAHSAIYDTYKTAELFCYFVNHYQTLGGWPRS